jgi:hypothetical protein
MVNPASMQNVGGGMQWGGEKVPAGAEALGLLAQFFQAKQAKEQADRDKQHELAKVLAPYNFQAQQGVYASEIEARNAQRDKYLAEAAWNRHLIGEEDRNTETAQRRGMDTQNKQPVDAKRAMENIGKFVAPAVEQTARGRAEIVKRSQFDEATLSRFARLFRVAPDSDQAQQVAQRLKMQGIDPLTVVQLFGE